MNKNNENNQIYKGREKEYHKEYMRNRNIKLNKEYGISANQVSKFGFKLCLEVFEKCGHKCSVCEEENKLCVHHLDGSGQTENPNNNLDNLQLLCQKCHGRLHASKRWSDKADEQGGYKRKGREKEYYREVDAKRRLSEKRKLYQREYSKKYQEKNKERLAEEKKIYYLENKDKWKESDKRNKESIRARSKEYYEKNKEICNERMKQWRKKKKEEQTDQR